MTAEKLQGGLLVACWLILCFMWFWAVLGLIWQQNEEGNNEG